MNNLELFKIEQERVKLGLYEIGDSLYRRCEDCNSNLIIQCDYVLKRGIRIWQCGFCQRDLKIKRGKKNGIQDSYRCR